MPQVFSAGWLYLFIIVMVISVVRIWFKLRTIQREAPMDRPVLRVAPVQGKEPGADEKSGDDPLLNETDELIRQKDYGKALKTLEKLLHGLSPTEDREARGKVLFRMGACHSRLADMGQGMTGRLRAVEALGEAVRLFAPVRFRHNYLRALGELAGVYEDMAREKSPVENLTRAARTSETAAAAASQGGLARPEAMFLARAAHAYRQLAFHGESQVNLRKAADGYEKAAGILGSVDDDDAARERMNLLKIQGDTCRELARFFQKADSLAWAARCYEGALEIMDEEEHLRERCVVLTDASSVLLELYDSERSPAHLRQALRYTRDALEAARGEEFIVQRGLTMAVMGDALDRYADVKDRQENLKRAVMLYESALGIFKDGIQPEERERVKDRLAETVRKLSPESG